MDKMMKVKIYGFILMIGLGIGPLYMLSLRVLSSNLKRHVGLWTGITLFGIGISSMFLDQWLPIYWIM